MQTNLVAHLETSYMEAKLTYLGDWNLVKFEMKFLESDKWYTKAKPIRRGQKIHSNKRTNALSFYP